MAKRQRYTLYQYAELPTEAAKRKAREWYARGEAEDFDPEYVIEDATRVAELLGVTFDTRAIKLMGGGTRTEPRVWWTLHTQGQGANFDGRYAYRKGSVKELKAYAPQDEVLHRIAGELADVQKRHGYKVTATIKAGRETHAHDTEIAVYVGDDEVYRGDEAHETTAEPVREALRDFMRWIHGQIEAEYDYRQSDEAVIESIEANAYEFYEDGSRASRYGG